MSEGNMVTCKLCEGWGKRYETVVEHTIEKQCSACEGLGKVPWVANWRPFEATKETIQAGRAYNRCNLHTDCEAADAKAAETGAKGRRGVVGQAYHCWSDDCEECFGC
jgi:hypothetical protein